VLHSTGTAPHAPVRPHGVSLRPAKATRALAALAAATAT
jgi:hypothetical protein